MTGRLTAQFAELGRWAYFSAEVLAGFPWAIARPGALLAQLRYFLLGTLGMVLVVGGSVGIVTWLHVGALLARFDSEVLLPTVLMLAVVNEFGPVSVGLVAAGRLASGIAAELAAMKTSEQIDALRCLGCDPVRWLLAPRVLACALALPLLTVVTDYAALLGGFAAESIAGELSWTLYYQHAVENLDLRQATLSTAKTVVFGLLIGAIACWQGVMAGEGADAVGHAATTAVVQGTLAVLISNVFLVALIQRLV